MRISLFLLVLSLAISCGDNPKFTKKNRDRQNPEQSNPSVQDETSAGPGTTSSSGTSDTIVTDPSVTDPTTTGTTGTTGPLVTDPVVADPATTNTTSTSGTTNTSGTTPPVVTDPVVTDPATTNTTSTTGTTNNSGTTDPVVTDPATTNTTSTTGTTNNSGTTDPVVTDPATTNTTSTTGTTDPVVTDPVVTDPTQNPKTSLKIEFKSSPEMTSVNLGSYDIGKKTKKVEIIVINDGETTIDQVAIPSGVEFQAEVQSNSCEEKLLATKSCSFSIRYEVLKEGTVEREIFVGFTKQAESFTSNKLKAIYEGKVEIIQPTEYQDPILAWNVPNLQGEARPILNNSLDLGKVATDKPLPLTLILKNVGTVGVIQLNLKSNNERELVIKSTDCPQRLMPTEECKVNVTFLVPGPAKITASGESIVTQGVFYYPLEIKGEKTFLNDETPTEEEIQVLVLDGKDLDFGKVYIGDTFQKFLTIEANKIINATDLEATLNAPEFKLAQPKCENITGNLVRCRYPVTFKPRVVGHVTGTIHVKNPAANGQNQATIRVTGEGITKPAAEDCHDWRVIGLDANPTLPTFSENDLPYYQSRPGTRAKLDLLLYGKQNNKVTVNRKSVPIVQNAMIGFSFPPLKINADEKLTSAKLWLRLHKLSREVNADQTEILCLANIKACSGYLFQDSFWRSLINFHFFAPSYLAQTKTQLFANELLNGMHRMSTIRSDDGDLLHKFFFQGEINLIEAFQLKADADKAKLTTNVLKFMLADDTDIQNEPILEAIVRKKKLCNER